MDLWLFNFDVTIYIGITMVFWYEWVNQKHSNAKTNAKHHDYCSTVTKPLTHTGLYLIEASPLICDGLVSI